MLTDRRIKHPRLSSSSDTHSDRKRNTLKLTSTNLLPPTNLLHEASPPNHENISLSSSLNEPLPPNTSSLSNLSPTRDSKTAPSDDTGADDDREEEKQTSQETTASSQELNASPPSVEPFGQDSSSTETNLLTKCVDESLTEEESTDPVNSHSATLASVTSSSSSSTENPDASSDTLNNEEDTDKKPTVKPYSLKTATTHKVNFGQPPSSGRLNSPRFSTTTTTGNNSKYGFFSRYSPSSSSSSSGPSVVPRPTTALRRNVSFPTPDVTSAVMNQTVDNAVVKTEKGEFHVKQPLPLEYAWSFLYTAPKGNDRGDSQSDWEEDIQTLVDKINTVQNFCQLWNYVPDLREPFRMPCGSNIYFFRSGVMPAWEDPYNVGGGRLTIVPEGRDVNVANVWRDILLDIVGATLPHSEAICGVVYNHKDTDRFDIWLTRAAFNRKNLSNVGEDICGKLQRSFSKFRVYHKSHPNRH